MSSWKITVKNPRDIEIRNKSLQFWKAFFNCIFYYKIINITMEELIKQIFQLERSKKDKEEEQAKLKEDISNLDTEIQEKKKLLLNAMKEAKSNEITTDDIVATYFSKENINYTSDKDVLDYLKQNNYNDLITVKTTESLNKNALKKALKTDNNLNKALEDMTVKSITEWVVVTDSETHQKMLEHIEENSKSKEN